jgi:hypothetical protein
MFEEYFKLAATATKFPQEIPNVDREELAKLFCKLGFRRGAEIGTNEAVYTKILCENNPEAEIFGVDPQIPYVDFETPARQPHYDALFKKTQEVLAPYPKCKLVRKTSMEAVKDFEDGSLDFVYIDGSHTFENVYEDIVEWTKKIKVGGIISGHDWFTLARTKYPLQVKEAVSAYVNENKITPWYVLGEKNAKPGEKRDKQRSWMWFKK